MKNKQWLILVVAAFLLSIFVPSALAQDESPSGVDLVFLIDQSGSTAENDLGKIRYRGTDFALEWAGWTLLTYDDEGKQDYRVSIVDFGAIPEVALPWYSISPSTEEEWRNEAQGLQEKLVPDNRSDASLGETNFHAAFEEALRRFEEINSEEDPSRLRVIVLVTDGIASVAGESSEQHMERVKQLVESNFPSDMYQIHVLAMQNPTQSYWSAVEESWNEISKNNAKLVEDNRVLGGDIQDILGKLSSELGIAPEDKVTCGPQSVEPFLDELRFTFHKPSPDSIIQLYDANGSLINQDSDLSVFEVSNSLVQYTGKGTSIESVAIYDPVPGDWRIECPDLPESPPIFRREVANSSSLSLPDATPVLLAPIQFEYRTFNHDGGIKEPYENSKYGLSVQLLISQADNEELVGLIWESSHEAYVGQWIPTDLGKHELHLEVKSQDTEGTTKTVESRELPPVHVGQPELNVEIGDDWRQFTKQQFKLNLTDSNGVILPLTDARDYLKINGSVEVNDETYALEWHIDDDGGASAVFTPRFSGPHSLRTELVAPDPSGREIVLASSGDIQFDVAPIQISWSIDTQIPLMEEIHLNLETPSDLDESMLKSLQIVLDIDGELVQLFRTEDSFEYEYFTQKAGSIPAHAIIYLTAPGQLARTNVGEIALPSLHVIEPRLNLDVEPELPNLFEQGSLRLTISDFLGRDIVELLPSGYEISAEVVAKNNGSEQKITLSENSDGILTGNFRPFRLGEHSLLTNVNAVDNSTGEIIPLISQHESSFLVRGLSQRMTYISAIFGAVLALCLMYFVYLWYRRRCLIINHGYLIIDNHAFREGTSNDSAYADVLQLEGRRQRTCRGHSWAPNTAAGLTVRTILTSQQSKHFKDILQAHIEVFTEPGDFKLFDRLIQVGDVLPLRQSYQLRIVEELSDKYKNIIIPQQEEESDYAWE